ncbi:MAG: hypothetical protein ACXVCP_12630 [Bdellovibrio sp.]
MTLKNQMTLVILGVLVAAIAIRNSQPKHVAVVDSATKPSTVKIESHRYLSDVPPTSHQQPKQRSSQPNTFSEVNRQQTATKYVIPNDINLDQKTRDNLQNLFDIAEREKDFLLNEVKVSPKVYNEIKRQRILVQWQLRDAALEQRTKGTNQEEKIAAILTNYAHWMQSTIGVGYYKKLLSISAPELKENI